MANDIKRPPAEGFLFLVGTHRTKDCGGTVTMIAKDSEHLLDLTSPDCGPIPGDAAQCQLCGIWFGYDGNFWTENKG